MGEEVGDNVCNAVHAAAYDVCRKEHAKVCPAKKQQKGKKWCVKGGKCKKQDTEHIFEVAGKGDAHNGKAVKGISGNPVLEAVLKCGEFRNIQGTF